MQVFLSYSHSDTPVAEAIRATLASCGLAVWSDARISPGASVAERVATGINASDAVLVVLGKDTAGRQWTSLEIGGALASGKPIVPVLVDQEAEIPVLLQDRKYLDMSDPHQRGDALGAVCEAVRSAPSASEIQRGGAGALIRGANAALSLEMGAWSHRIEERERRVRRSLLVASVISVLAAAAALVLAAASETAAVAAIGAGLGALVASAIGFYLGSASERQTAAQDSKRALERLDRFRDGLP